MLSLMFQGSFICKKFLKRLVTICTSLHFQFYLLTTRNLQPDLDTQVIAAG